MRRCVVDGQIDSIPEALARSRHRGKRAHFAVRRLGATRFTTDGLTAESSVSSSWLMDVVVRVVTTYSVPGDRVLLVSVGNGRSRRHAGVCGGLEEVAWSVVRLGRGVRTRTVGTHGQSESGLGPIGTEGSVRGCLMWLLWRVIRRQ
jgi:hypothetical protein